MHNEKPIAAVLSETREELKNFVQTRVAILKAELSGKIKSWKALIPMAIVAAVLLLAAWFAITFTAVALLATLFQPSPFAWLGGADRLSSVYLAIGAILGVSAVNRIKAVQMVPPARLRY